MGFWKKFAKIAIPIGAAVAAPFTGGSSLLALGAGAGAATGALDGGWKGALLGGGLGAATGGLLGGGGGAAGSAATKAGGMSLGSTLLKNIPQIAQTLGPVLSGQAKGSADQRIAEAPELRGAYNSNLAGTQLGDKRAILASLLGGASDASIGRPAGSTIPTFGITGGLRPSAFSDKAGLLSRLQTPIKPLEMPTAGGLEKGLGIAGMAGQILGALPQFGARPPSPSTATPPPLPSTFKAGGSPPLLPQAPQNANNPFFSLPPGGEWHEGFGGQWLPGKKIPGAMY